MGDKQPLPRTDIASLALCHEISFGRSRMMGHADNTS